MPKRGKGLTAKEISSIKKPGRYADGNGLYLQIARGGSKSWIFRHSFGGARREMGLGSVRGVSLAEAREVVRELNRALADGLDPRQVRNAGRGSTSTPTFAEAARQYIDAQRPAWSNAKHADQWSSTLATYAYPVMGSMTVDDIGPNHVLQVLTPIWTTKTETASRVRGRIEAILDYAKVQGWRTGENPAAWRGNLVHALPSKSKVGRPRGHLSLHYTELPTFWLRLLGTDGTAARALEFLILTAARSGEVREATFAEIDWSAAVWTVPAERMKNRREHRVPLSRAALTLIRKMEAIKSSEYIFAGARKDRPLSDMSMTQTLSRLGMKGIATPHGFRSTFRTWAAEETSVAHEVCEAALSHYPSDKVVLAYQRGDYFERRRELMNYWENFVQGELL